MASLARRGVAPVRGRDGRAGILAALGRRGVPRRRPSVARGPRRARPGAELRSRHAALPRRYPPVSPQVPAPALERDQDRSEEHTSELQSHSDLVCRLLLEKKKKKCKRQKIKSYK